MNQNFPSDASALWIAIALVCLASAVVCFCLRKTLGRMVIALTQKKPIEIDPIEKRLAAAVWLSRNLVNRNLLQAIKDLMQYIKETKLECTPDSKEALREALEDAGMFNYRQDRINEKIDQVLVAAEAARNHMLVLTALVEEAVATFSGAENQAYRQTMINCAAIGKEQCREVLLAAEFAIEQAGLLIIDYQEVIDDIASSLQAA